MKQNISSKIYSKKANTACRKKLILGVLKDDFIVEFFGLKSRLNKSIIKTLRLPNFKGSACKLDFPALHKSNFAAYNTGR